MKKMFLSLTVFQFMTLNQSAPITHAAHWLTRLNLEEKHQGRLLEQLEAAYEELGKIRAEWEKLVPKTELGYLKLALSSPMNQKKFIDKAQKLYENLELLKEFVRKANSELKARKKGAAETKLQSQEAALELLVCGHDCEETIRNIHQSDLAQDMYEKSLAPKFNYLAEIVREHSASHLEEMWNIEDRLSNILPFLECLKIGGGVVIAFATFTFLKNIRTFA